MINGGFVFVTRGLADLDRTTEAIAENNDPATNQELVRLVCICTSSSRHAAAGACLGGPHHSDAG